MTRENRLVTTQSQDVPPELELQIAIITNQLQTSDNAKLDWAYTLSSATVAVGIPEECLLITSTPKAGLVLLDNSRLRWFSYGVTCSEVNSWPALRSPYLLAHLRECAMIGRNSFVAAEVKMGKLLHILTASEEKTERWLKFVPSPDSENSRS